MQVQTERLWQTEQIVELIHEALGIVEQVAPPGDLREQVYATAVQLVTQVSVTPHPLLAGRTLGGS